MNKDLKNHIIAREDYLEPNTKHIYSDNFFKNLTIVTNALDNLKARLYVDERCIKS